MAMGKRWRRPKQTSIWVATQDLPRTVAHPFYTRLNRIAHAHQAALRPPGYPHRPSAVLNPLAPITHHWLDSTHVVFGVVTLGVHNQRWKVEASVFNGREPDESRVDLDVARFDSVAGRVFDTRDTSTHSTGTSRM